jgi:putative inorganic carbon (HCO3(-)) transporter
MAFRLFLLCAFVLLARPQDILTFLQPMRPALVATGLALAALAFGGRPKELARGLSMPESKRYLLFFVIMVLGVPFAHHQGQAFGGVFAGYSVNVLFFVLLVSQVSSLERVKSLAWVICLSTLTYAAFGGILQIPQFEGRFSVVGGLLDPNDTAYVLVSLFPACLYFFRYGEGLLMRLAAVAAVCCAIAVILFTGSRGGVIALGTVLALALVTTKSGIEKRYKILFVLMLAGTWLLLEDRVDVERYLSLSEVSEDYNVTGQEGRLTLWQGAIELALANPLTGVGVDCFEYAYFLAREAADNPYLRWHSVHNSLLQVAAEVGLVGFAVFLSINVQCFLTLYRVSKTTQEQRLNSRDAAELGALGGLLLLGFIGHLVSGFFLTQGYSLFSTLYFALAAAIGRVHGALLCAPSPASTIGLPADDPSGTAIGSAKERSSTTVV